MEYNYKKFSELQKQYIDYLTKCSNDLKEKESILKAYDTCLHNNKILCEAVKELLKPDADVVKVNRKLGEIKCLKWCAMVLLGLQSLFAFLNHKRVFG